jgi:hypothetical protein
MNELIAALQILAKYIEPGSSQEKWPTYCSHDLLTVCVDPERVSEADKAELDRLGFFADDECFGSHRFGSC